MQKTVKKIREPEIGSIFGEEELDAIRTALVGRSESLSWGHELFEFEKEFAAYCGVEHAIAVSSGTAALDICAQVLHLQLGDEIIATPQTFWSTISAQVGRGISIRFADIEQDTLNIDPTTVEALVTPRTKAIYATHYGGNPVNLAPLRVIAERHRLVLLQDCCHAPGAKYQGQRIGVGDLCVFSFHSYKNMTTLGEGGMITTNNAEYAKQIRNLRSIGVALEGRLRTTQNIGPYRKPEFEVMDHSHGAWDFDVVRVDEIGSNFRMTAVAAAVGRVQLRKLDTHNAARQRVAERYNEILSRIPGIRTTRVRPGDTSAWHLYTCFLELDCGVDRNELLRHMQNEHGVTIVLRYWPLHLHMILRAAGHQFGESPVCEKVWFEQQINLPLGPLLSEERILAITDALASGMKRCRR